MQFHNHLRRASSQLLALAVSSTLLGSTYLLPSAAFAQSRVDNTQLLAQNTLIRATSAQTKNLYLNKNRIYSYDLEVSNDTRINGRYVPAGSKIRGRYEPASGGLRYVTRQVVINGRTYNLNAISDVLKDVKDPRDTSVGAIAGDAGIGAAGAILIGEIFGNADIEEILGGAAAGAAIGNITADRVVVIRSDEPITLYSRY
ncbi:MAG: hypothetical protein HC836_19540 [Richelia sp. RM2_1_2]|nr:hypothetical protein [Richelia sp. RM1_1_1]NJO60379.1 hypothetical protein [Richelia sp. RM2_1_2]